MSEYRISECRKMVSITWTFGHVTQGWTFWVKDFSTMTPAEVYKRRCFYRGHDAAARSNIITAISMALDDLLAEPAPV